MLPSFNHTPSLSKTGVFSALKLKREGKEHEAFNDDE